MSDLEFGATPGGAEGSSIAAFDQQLLQAYRPQCKTTAQGRDLRSVLVGRAFDELGKPHGVPSLELEGT